MRFSVLLCFSLSTAASASITVFENDQAAWEAALGRKIVIDFDDVEIPSGVTAVIIDGDKYGGFPGSPKLTTDQVNSLTLLPSSGAVSPPNILSSVSPVRVDFDQPVLGFGGTFLNIGSDTATTGFDTDQDGIPDVHFSSNALDSPQSFLGFTSDSPLNSVDIHFGSSATFDDLTYSLENTLPAAGKVIVLHEGANNPLDEGWIQVRGFRGFKTFPVFNDQGSGFDAWAVDDANNGNGEGHYLKVMTEEEIRIATERGWRLTANLRYASDRPTDCCNKGSVRFGYLSGQQGSSVSLKQNPDGSFLNLGVLDSGYHQFELIYDPADRSTELFIDGEFIISGKVGETTFVEPGGPGVFFGSNAASGTGQGNYNLIKLEIFPELQPGDANQDFSFDQADLVQVLVQGSKYLTGQPATWGEGDWDGGPGGTFGNPPTGNGVFDQFDLITALQAGFYLTGPYSALNSGGSDSDEQTSLIYEPTTGELSVDAPAGKNLTSINMTSAAGLFQGTKPSVLDGAFDNFDSTNIFKATFGGSFGSISFGNVLPTGLGEQDIVSDLTVVGSLEGGGGLGDVDLVWIPEPSTFLLFLIGVMCCFSLRRGSD